MLASYSKSDASNLMLWRRIIVLRKRRGKLTDEDFKLLNSTPSDEELISKFIRDCHLRNLRDATIKYYLNELSSFRQNLFELSIEKKLIDVEKEDIESVILHLKRKIKIVSINTRLRAIKVFYNYLQKENIINYSPVNNIRKLRDRERIMETLDDKEIVLIANHIKNQNTFVGIRDYSIFLLFIDTGIRLSELVGIRVEDVKKDQIVIRNTKNLNERSVYPNNKTQNAIQKYLKLRGKLHHNYLFVNNEDEPLKRRSVQTRFEKYKEELNFTKQLSPHIFRHTYAKRAIMSGMDAFSLASLLGHSDITITKRYVNLWGNDLEEKAKRFSSIDKLKI
jgi:site-specific recombinase XerD